MIKHRIELLDLTPANPVVVEVGVAEGLFSRDLLDAGAGLLYSVDNWNKLDQRGDGGFDQEWHDNNFEHAKSILSVFGERSVMLRGLSVDMAGRIKDNSVDLVYIDGDHSYIGVKRDMAAYWPKLKVGGIMAFHDYEATEYGVKQAVMEFAAFHGLEIHLIPENTLADAGAYFYKKAS